MTRNEVSAARLRADGIEAVVADLATPDRLSVALEGVDSISPREQMAILSQVLGRTLQAEEVTIEQAHTAIRGAGWPAWCVERMGELFRLYADGKATETSPDVEHVTGRAPRSALQFANDHADVFVAR